MRVLEIPYSIHLPLDRSLLPWERAWSVKIQLKHAGRRVTGIYEPKGVPLREMRTTLYPNATLKQHRGTMAVVPYAARCLPCYPRSFRLR